MNTYEVTLPIAGVAYLTVTAETKDEAIEAAISVVVKDDIEEWDAHRYISRGNVLYVTCNEAKAVEVSSDV